MVFRPATPLSVLLFVAFALLLLSTLSAPIIESINIATFGGVKFGVFGWCSEVGCSAVSFSYDMDTILLNEGTTDFSLPSKARNSLTNLLIVHPIAAFMTLVLFILSVAAHLHKPAHSPKYLLALLIFCLPTVMVSLLAFLVDILIFLPHMQWGGWIVLVATILNAIGGIVMCSMRRQIVGRIARSKRIQESAEMNGQSYFARAQTALPENQDKLPEFATFETGPVQPEGERIPLNPRMASPPPQDDLNYARSNTLRTEGSDRSNYGGSQHRGNGPLGLNPIGGNAMGPGQVRSQYSNQTLQTSISGSSGHYGSPQHRGSGGGYPVDRGDRGYGTSPLPGGFDGSTQSRYGPPPGAAGGFRGGPPGPSGYEREPRRGSYTGYGPGQGQMRGPALGYGPTPITNGYGPPPPNNNGYGPPPNNNTYGPPPGQYRPPLRAGPPSSAMGVGMGIGGGLRAPPPPRQPAPQRDSGGYDYPIGIEDNHSDERREFEQTLATDRDIVGRGLSEDGRGENDRLMPRELSETDSDLGGRLAVVNATQPTYEDDSYVPPRAQWQDVQASTGTVDNQPLQKPVELPATMSPRAQPLEPSSRSPSPKPKLVSDTYYEDVAPQFDSPYEQQPPRIMPPMPSSSPHPPSLVPGGNAAAYDPLPPPVLDNLNDGQRSPTMSTTSGFTSVSQRGINPRWQEEQQQQGRMGPRPQGGGGPGRSNVVLSGNPDFELPVRGQQRGPGRGDRGGGMASSYR